MMGTVVEMNKSSGELDSITIETTSGKRINWGNCQFSRFMNSDDLD